MGTTNQQSQPATDSDHEQQVYVGSREASTAAAVIERYWQLAAALLHGDAAADIDWRPFSAAAGGLLVLSWRQDPGRHTMGLSVESGVDLPSSQRNGEGAAPRQISAPATEAADSSRERAKGKQGCRCVWSCEAQSLEHCRKRASFTSAVTQTHV